MDSAIIEVMAAILFMLEKEGMLVFLKNLECVIARRLIKENNFSTNLKNKRNGRKWLLSYGGIL